MLPMYEVVPIKVRKFDFINYSYLIIDRATREAALIDPAWQLEVITACLDTHNAVLTSIILTHSHMDHVNLVHPLLEWFDVPVYMGEQEIEYYQYDCRNLRAVSDQDVLLLGNTRITCLWTPGHTAGSYSFLLQDSLFTGDTLFIEGCGLCTAKGGDPAQLYRSLQKLRQRIRPEVRIYPGHSYGKEPGYPLSYLFDYNIYFHFDSEEQFIQFRMRKNQNNLFRFR